METSQKNGCQIRGVHSGAFVKHIYSNNIRFESVPHVTKIVISAVPYLPRICDSKCSGFFFVTSMTSAYLHCI